MTSCQLLTILPVKSGAGDAVDLCVKRGTERFFIRLTGVPLYYYVSWQDAPEEGELEQAVTTALGYVGVFGPQRMRWVHLERGHQKRRAFVRSVESCSAIDILDGYNAQTRRFVRLEFSDMAALRASSKLFPAGTYEADLTVAHRVALDAGLATGDEIRFTEDTSWPLAATSHAPSDAVLRWRVAVLIYDRAAWLDLGGATCAAVTLRAEDLMCVTPDIVFYTGSRFQWPRAYWTLWIPLRFVASGMCGDDPVAYLWTVVYELQVVAQLDDFVRAQRMLVEDCAMQPAAFGAYWAVLRAARAQAPRVLVRDVKGSYASRQHFWAPSCAPVRGLIGHIYRHCAEYALWPRLAALSNVCVTTYLQLGDVETFDIRDRVHTYGGWFVERRVKQAKLLSWCGPRVSVSAVLDFLKLYHEPTHAALQQAVATAVASFDDPFQGLRVVYADSDTVIVSRDVDVRPFSAESGYRVLYDYYMRLKNGGYVAKVSGDGYICRGHALVGVPDSLRQRFLRVLFDEDDDAAVDLMVRHARELASVNAQEDVAQLFTTLDYQFVVRYRKAVTQQRGLRNMHADIRRYFKLKM